MYRSICDMMQSLNAVHYTVLDTLPPSIYCGIPVRLSIAYRVNNVCGLMCTP